MYQKGCIMEGTNSERQNEPSGPIPTPKDDILASSLLIIDPSVLNESLSMFSRHLGAECPFIDTEILTNHFNRNGQDDNLDSHTLIYTVCCLGARILPHEKTSAKIDTLVHYVYKLLSLNDLRVSRLTTVQAYLMLSIYELGAGNNTKAWVLSGG